MNNINATFNSISEFLGETRIDKLKDRVVDSLICNLEDSIEEQWVVAPNDFTEMWNEVFEEVKTAVMQKYKAKLKKALCNKVEEYIKSLEVEE